MSILSARLGRRAPGARPERTPLRERRLVRGLAATIATVLLGAGLTVVAAAAPASAHHTSISAHAVCASGGTAVVTWSVANSQRDTKATITESSAPGVVPVGTKLGKGATKQFTQAGVKPGATVKIALTTEWDNGVTYKDQASYTVSADLCGGGDGNNWTYPAPTCAALEVVYPQGVRGNDVNIRFLVDGKELTLNFHNNGGNWSGTQAFRYADHRDWPKPAPEAFSIVWVQVDGTNFHWKGEVLCGNDKLTICHATGSDSNPYEKITIAKSAVVNAHIKHQHTEDVIPAFTYKGESYEAQGDQSLLAYEECVKPPTQVRVPPAPGYDDACGPDNEQLGELTDGLGYRWDEPVYGPTTITVTVRTTDGYVFADGTTSHQYEPFAIDDRPCPPVVTEKPAKPHFSDACGVGNTSFTEPVDSTQFDWTIDRDSQPGSIIVTVAAQPGYVLPEGADRRWVFEIDDTECAPEVIPILAVPTGADTCGPENGDLDVPTPPANAHYAFAQTGSEQSGTVTITAVADKGYTFAPTQQTEWVFRYVNTDCVVPAAPSVTDLCGPDNEQPVLPALPEGAEWKTERVDGQIVITAVILDETTHGFAADAQTRWTFTPVDRECVAPVLEGSLATGVCLADVPWIFYDVVLTDPDHQSDGSTVTLTLTDGTNTEVIELGDLDEDGTLSGQTLWPGASVDDEGNATGWPGWEQTADGFWVETDGNFAWTRGVTDAVLAVNPSVDVDLTYPPATPNCLTSPPAPPGGDGAATPAASGEGSGLASTGFAGATIAIVAGIIVIAGIAFVVVARIRRKKA